MITQFFGQEYFKGVTGVGTTFSLLSGSRFKLAGKGAFLSSNLNCNLASSGLNGLDVGSIQNYKEYYIYAVISGGTLGLVASLSNNSPSGFSVYRKVGVAITGASGTIVASFKYGDKIGNMNTRFGPTNSTAYNTTYATIALNVLLGDYEKMGITLSGNVITFNRAMSVRLTGSIPTFSTDGAMYRVGQIPSTVLAYSTNAYGPNEGQPNSRGGYKGDFDFRKQVSAGEQWYFEGRSTNVDGSTHPTALVDGAQTAWNLHLEPYNHEFDWTI